MGINVIRIAHNYISYKLLEEILTLTNCHALV